MLRRVLIAFLMAPAVALIAALLSAVVTASSPKTAVAVRPVGAAVQAPSASDERTVLDEAARRDLATLPKKLSWSPLLPSTLASGFAYVRVTTGEQPFGTIRSVDVFISGPDTSMGNRAIHIHEGVPTPGVTGIHGKPHPMDVYHAVLQPVALSNGTWHVMQQDHSPWKGAWNFMAQRGDMFIEVDGLVSRETLQGFVATLR